jgi:hypothetical protein
VSKFANAGALRGRLIIVEPTKLEHDIPKSAKNPDGPKGDRVTATVTVVDGQGPLQVTDRFGRPIPGQFIQGEVHRGVWFGQDQLAAGLTTEDGKELVKMVLCRIDTLKPGTEPEQGNPWVMNAVTDEDRQTARDYLAGRRIAAASGPTAPAASTPKNPWA